METGTSARGRQADRRGRLNQAIREALRDLGTELSLLSQRISGHLDLKGTDLQCLDLIDGHGPLSPGTLARMAGIHPATLTGVDCLPDQACSGRARRAENRELHEICLSAVASRKQPAT